MPEFTCPKCGAVLPVKPGTQMTECSYCGTITYIDRSSALFFYLLPFSIDEGAAKGIFKRWCANPAYAKDLEASAKISKIAKEYFPVFRFRRTISGKETVFVKPARTTLLPGMQNLIIPPGNMQIYDSSVSTSGIEVIHPDISIDSYLPELTGEPIDQALVYFPIYEIFYTYSGESYSVVIDGSSGRVSSANAPNRSSASYVGVMGLAFVLGLMGGLLGIFVNPVFFVMILAGIFVGKVLAHQVVKRAKPAAGGSA